MWVWSHRYTVVDLDTVKTVIGSFRRGSLGCNLTSPVPSDLFGTMEILLAVLYENFFFLVATANLL
jgi:hypothetical protein